VPVLFVTLIRNYHGFNGFRLNTKYYSAYPEEQEYVFNEGFECEVLGTDDDVVIRN